MIRHLVALRYAPGTTGETKTALMQDLAGLSGHIDGILDFQVRANVSVEDPLVRGFRDLFWFDFRDTGVRAPISPTPRTRRSVPGSWPRSRAGPMVSSSWISRSDMPQPLHVAENILGEPPAGRRGQRPHISPGDMP
ncbi:Dabb family protein [Ovoidimarina sediminis]|uniref:Dabb family protein n=1 Tax=Ovoidimarina sediminis TaxID=3079856 RepID=UPI002914E13A|nr:Dabb family protein [Rhodophyticola sp. MJ-SS7]MDU8944057.1 Dabb family protein [Rhodophyticola sp. MJ-SS7]